jgi:hypothetical protein
MDTNPQIPVEPPVQLSVQAPVTPVQPPMQTPAASGSNHLGAIAGAVVLVLLVVGGIYVYFVQGERIMELLYPASSEQHAPQISAENETTEDDVDQIEAELNATGDASSETELDQLEQSL